MSKAILSKGLISFVCIAAILCALVPRGVYCDTEEILKQADQAITFFKKTYQDECTSELKMSQEQIQVLAENVDTFRDLIESTSQQCSSLQASDCELVLSEMENVYNALLECLKQQTIAPSAPTEEDILALRNQMDQFKDRYAQFAKYATKTCDDQFNAEGQAEDADRLIESIHFEARKMREEAMSLSAAYCGSTQDVEYCTQFDRNYIEESGSFVQCLVELGMASLREAKDEKLKKFQTSYDTLLVQAREVSGKNFQACEKLFNDQTASIDTIEIFLGDEIKLFQMCENEIGAIAAECEAVFPEHIRNRCNQYSLVYLDAMSSWNTCLTKLKQVVSPTPTDDQTKQTQNDIATFRDDFRAFATDTLSTCTALMNTDMPLADFQRDAQDLFNSADQYIPSFVNSVNQYVTHCRTVFDEIYCHDFELEYSGHSAAMNDCLNDLAMKNARMGASTPEVKEIQQRYDTLLSKATEAATVNGAKCQAALQDESLLAMKGKALHPIVTRQHAILREFSKENEYLAEDCKKLIKTENAAFHCNAYDLYRNSVYRVWSECVDALQTAANAAATAPITEKEAVLLQQEIDQFRADFIHQTTISLQECHKQLQTTTSTATASETDDEFIKRNAAIANMEAGMTLRLICPGVRSLEYCKIFDNEYFSRSFELTTCMNALAMRDARNSSDETIKNFQLSFDDFAAKLKTESATQYAACANALSMPNTPETTYVQIGDSYRALLSTMQEYVIEMNQQCIAVLELSRCSGYEHHLTSIMSEIMSCASQAEIRTSAGSQVCQVPKKDEKDEEKKVQSPPTPPTPPTPPIGDTGVNATPATKDIVELNKQILKTEKSEKKDDDEGTQTGKKTTAAYVVPLIVTICVVCFLVVVGVIAFVVIRRRSAARSRPTTIKEDDDPLQLTGLNVFWTGVPQSEKNKVLSL